MYMMSYVVTNCNVLGHFMTMFPIPIPNSLRLFQDKFKILTKICTPTYCCAVDQIIKELVKCQTQAFLIGFYTMIIWQWINSLVWVSEVGQPSRSLVISYDVVFVERRAQLCQILIGDTDWRLKAANLYLQLILIRRANTCQCKIPE